MTLSVGYSLLIIFVIASITFALRAAPFLLFSRTGRTPKVITYLGNALPPAVMGMLIIYCLRNVDFFSRPFGIPEGIAVLAVIFLHLWRKNNLLSILGGTVIYMVLVQLIF
ncbi:branched-chain amino acid transporter permease [Sinanaerobacter chloroacetimidivorans]|uniref:AzlD domain-containing protein n=1 Tax=Sinanaerobacter chloroacetimidivorans TaxID=2818044 RepID=A0A8J8B0K7_9FIRM|nr:AzlD domain-containing protein [Sinanaerobacter chloroacetimidivorans]MBR0596887.1 AzlD domain-containing protein [Sinanaerobacter chloroacetimidivorans]